MSRILVSAPGVKPRAVTQNIRGWSARSRAAFNALNLHYAGLAIVLLVNLYLIIQMIFLWRQVSNNNADALAAQQIALQTAEIQARPLEGLDVKLAQASAASDGFYTTRLPANYSEIYTQLGVLTRREGVHLTHVNYAEAAVAGKGTSAQAAGQLTEIRMDASLTGDYRSLVVFLNQLERSKMFFLINTITLAGQQTGSVNLRIRLTTYVRGLTATEDRKLANTPASALDRDLDQQAAAEQAAAGQATRTGGPR